MSGASGSGAHSARGVRTKNSWPYFTSGRRGWKPVVSSPSLFSFAFRHFQSERLDNRLRVIIRSQSAICSPDQQMPILNLNDGKFSLWISISFFDFTQDRVNLLRGLC